MQIYQYSTVPFRLKLSFNPAECTALYLTFKQGDITLEKSLEDLADSIAAAEYEKGRYVMEFAFTQEESEAFDIDEDIFVQATFIFEGVRDSTNIAVLRLKEVLKEEVI